MRRLGAVALTLVLAGCGGARRHASPALTGQITVVLENRHALLLHEGQTAVVGRGKTAVVCVSHGTTLTAQTPHGTGVGRDVWRRGPFGTASLSVSTSADGRVTATCE